MEIIVTLIGNIQTDHDGKYLLDEEGGLLLHDEEDVGFMRQTHIVPLTQVIEGAVHTGVSSLCEVYWNKHRSPAPALVAPAELAWLSVNNEEDFDDEYQDEENHGQEAEDFGEHEESDYPVETFSEQ